ARVELHDLASSAVRPTRATVIHQKRLLARLRAAPLEVFFDRHRSLLSEGTLPLFAALGSHTDPALAQIEVVYIEPNQFTDAEAASVEQLEEGDIALRVGAFKLVLPNSVDQGVGLFGCGHDGHPL